MIYPLVNVYIGMENHHAFLKGISTISMAIFNSYLIVYQRVNVAILEQFNSDADQLGGHSHQIGIRDVRKSITVDPYGESYGDLSKHET